MSMRFRIFSITEARTTLLVMSAAVLITLLLPLMSPDVCADDAVPNVGTLSSINIRLSGNIVNLSCVVDPADVDKTVNLGDWATKQLRYPSGHSEPVAFNIRLTGCTASGVTLAFTGSGDKTDSTLLALNDESTASGVAIEIMDADHKRIALGSNSQRVAVDNNGDVTLQFSARYLAVASPVAGSADADSEFMLTYD
ncbi:fimbrial protein [Serratia liquefaciens]|uniref:fimbrial protein n=1 Tax=Serratia liquefaciens TaxID=614 RepID=UPI0037FBAFBE